MGSTGRAHLKANCKMCFRMGTSNERRLWVIRSTFAVLFIPVVGRGGRREFSREHVGIREKIELGFFGPDNKRISSDHIRDF